MSEPLSHAKERPFLGALLSFVVRLWVASLRVTVVGAPPAGGYALAFFHGSQMLGLRWRLSHAPRPLAVLVSHSRDGELQAALLRRLGFVIVRGSSSRGGAQGLRGLVRAARGGCDSATAVDGPRGPLHQAKPGILALARLSKVPIVPLGAAGARVHVLQRAWDQFQIPWPFSRVSIVLGPPISATPQTNEATITEAIVACERAAKARLTVAR